MSRSFGLQGCLSISTLKNVLCCRIVYGIFWDNLWPLIDEKKIIFSNTL